MNKIFKYIIHPQLLILALMNYNVFKFLPDKLYLKLKYKLKTGKKLNLNCPKNFNEKLQWLKLYDRKDIYIKMVDKCEVKKYVSNIIGNEYIIPTIGVYEKFEDINFEELPNQFVIKCTHDSGGLVICKDKYKFNINAARKTINKYLKRNYYYVHREWPYKNVKPRILIEEYMHDTNSDELKDYKLFCFNGIPKIILVCSERFSSSNMYETWFDETWNFLPIIENKHRVDSTIKRPINLNLMKNIASKLAKNISFVRIDFYEVNGNLYFGEITFFPASGYEKFEPEEWNKKLGDLIDLSIVKKYK